MLRRAEAVCGRLLAERLPRLMDDVYGRLRPELQVPPPLSQQHHVETTACFVEGKAPSPAELLPMPPVANTRTPVNCRSPFPRRTSRYTQSWLTKLLSTVDSVRVSCLGNAPLSPIPSSATPPSSAPS